MKSLPLLFIRLGISVLMLACIECAKEFKDVGPMKLHDYTSVDWVILAIGIGAVSLPNVLSFFDTTFSDYLQHQAANNALNGKPPISTSNVITAASVTVLLAYLAGYAAARPLPATPTLTQARPPMTAEATTPKYLTP
jgi:hypothetical protein